MAVACILHLGGRLWMTTIWPGAFGRALRDFHLGRSCNVWWFCPKANSYFYTTGCFWALSKWQVAPEGLAQPLNLGPGSAKVQVLRCRLLHLDLEQQRHSFHLSGLGRGKNERLLWQESAWFLKKWNTDLRHSDQRDSETCTPIHIASYTTVKRWK